ncbi:hypothetical protein [Sphingobium indicum]|uniref:hypothetical protein n=1 Tax=Sphingobium indicum TaxID=332055 RepID=UPI0012DCF746|nr:hypothetical protein [Sphingobium indicum]
MTRKWALLLAVATGANACTDRRLELTPSLFDIAKRQCEASDAYILASDPKSIGFRGFDPRHAQQAKCLVEQLKHTDARMIGFISEAPR